MHSDEVGKKIVKSSAFFAYTAGDASAPPAAAFAGKRFISAG
ncbi:hypothetical protein [Rudaea sp.]